MTKADRIKIIERCLDDGGRQVDGLNGFATSADQRAVTVASVYIAAATAIVAGILAFLSSNAISLPVIAAGIVAASMFYIGALFCLWTAFPEITYISGNPPPFWLYHLEKNSEYQAALETQIDEYKLKISENSSQRSAAAKRFKRGAFIGASAPIAALSTFWLAWALA